MELDLVHAGMKQQSLAARQAATRGFEAELSPRITRLLDQAPHRQYLDADELRIAACQRFAAETRPPGNLDFWLSGVVEEQLLLKLLRRSGEGDGDAENEFCKRLRPLLMPTLRRKLGRGSPVGRLVDVSDLIHTAYRRLAEEREKKGRIPPNLVPWLIQTVTNRVNDLSRRLEVASRHAPSLTERLPAAAAAVESGVLDKIADRELTAWAIDQMRPDVHAIYRLRFEEGLGWKEIGKAMGKATSTVWSMWEDWLEEVRGRDGCGGHAEEAH